MGLISDNNERVLSIQENFIKNELELKSLVQEIKFSTNSQDMLDELASVIRQKLYQMKQSVKDLKTSATEETNANTRNELDTTVSMWEDSIAENHMQFRKSILEAQLNIQKKCKEELFKTNRETDLRFRERTTREALAKQSSQLTDDLLNVTQMIRDNTEKSAKTVETLVDSSQNITSTQEEIKTMGSVIGQSRKILNKYGRRENTDKFLIFICLIFFVTACLLVLRNRSIL